MYVLFRARRLLGSVPALIALVLIALGIQSQTLKVEPVYDESAVELALVEPEPEVVPPPVAEQAPPPPVIEDEEAEPAPPPPPPPPPKPLPKPEPKPKPVPKPVVAKPTPDAAPRWRPNPRRRRSPRLHRHRPRPHRPRSTARPWRAVTSRVCVTSWTLTSNTPPDARPPSNAQVATWWSGCWWTARVGYSTPACRPRPRACCSTWAAANSLRRIKQVKPFPEQAFGGRNEQRFTATFNYSVQ